MFTTTKVLLLATILCLAILQSTAYALDSRVSTVHVEAPVVNVIDKDMKVGSQESFFTDQGAGVQNTETPHIDTAMSSIMSWFTPVSKQLADLYDQMPTTVKSYIVPLVEHVEKAAATILPENPMELGSIGDILALPPQLDTLAEETFEVLQSFSTPVVARLEVAAGAIGATVEEVIGTAKGLMSKVPKQIDTLGQNLPVVVYRYGAPVADHIGAAAAALEDLDHWRLLDAAQSWLDQRLAQLNGTSDYLTSFGVRFDTVVNPVRAQAAQFKYFVQSNSKGIGYLVGSLFLFIAVIIILGPTLLLTIGLGSAGIISGGLVAILQSIATGGSLVLVANLQLVALVALPVGLVLILYSALH